MASIAHKRPRPAALVVVALLFLLGGLAPFIGGSHVSTAGIGIFELVIGIGLLARKALARQVALAIIYLAMAWTIIIAAMLLIPNTEPIVGFGQWLWPHPIKLVGFIYTAVVLLLLVWQRHILRRADVRSFFQSRE